MCFLATSEHSADDDRIRKPTQRGRNHGQAFCMKFTVIASVQCEGSCATVQTVRGAVRTPPQH